MHLCQEPSVTAVPRVDRTDTRRNVSYVLPLFVDAVGLDEIGTAEVYDPTGVADSVIAGINVVNCTAGNHQLKINIMKTLFKCISCIFGQYTMKTKP